MAFIFQKVHFSSKPLRFYTVTVNIYRSGQKNPIYCLYIILLRVVWETRTNTSSDQGKVGYTLAARPVHPKATIQSSVLKKKYIVARFTLFSVQSATWLATVTQWWKETTALQGNSGFVLGSNYAKVFKYTVYT